MLFVLIISKRIIIRKSLEDVNKEKNNNNYQNTYQMNKNNQERKLIKQINQENKISDITLVSPLKVKEKT